MLIGKVLAKYRNSTPMRVPFWARISRREAVSKPLDERDIMRSAETLPEVKTRAARYIGVQHWIVYMTRFRGCPPS
jgi:hypothetical protein